MSAFALRDPVSTWTHLLGLAAAFPTTWILVRRALRSPAGGPAERAFRAGKVASLAIFGFGMASCYAASAAYHGPPATDASVALLRRLDMVGIFLLIAGTFTPTAFALMRPTPRLVAMILVWGVSIACGTALVLGRTFPTWLATSIYLGLGWGMALGYADIRRRRSARDLRLLPIGGALYSLGAVVNLLGVPRLAPGFGPHEIFHLFVLAGTAAHVRFLYRVVAPAAPPEADAGPDSPPRERASGRRPVSADA